MQTVLIESDAYTQAGIEILFFPGGEPHVKLPESYEGKEILFVLRARNAENILVGSLVLDALNRSGAAKVTAFIPYFPGARQDKEDGLSCLTISVMGKLFGRGRHRLITFDQHSQVLDAVVGQHVNFMPRDLEVPLEEGVVGIIAPDAGAVQRATHFRDAFYPTALLFKCTKKRDPRTGALSNYEIPPLLEQGRYVVVDDICDGGRTFNLLANAWARDPLGPKSPLTLFVSHGIFSKGVSALHQEYDQIITTDSWLPISRRFDDDRLKTLRLSQLYSRITGGNIHA